MAKKSRQTDVKEKAAKTGKKSGGLLFGAVSLVAALFVIAAVMAGFIFFIVKMNILGVADTYKDSLKNVPLLNLALPREEPSEPSEMTFDELLSLYERSTAKNDALQNEIDGASKRIDELSRAKSEFEAQILITNEKAEQMQRQVMTLEAEKKRLDEMKYEIERAVAAGDKETFAGYFETVSPEVAQEIYAQIVHEQKLDEEKRQFIKLFQTLDSKTSASIIETLGSSRIDFIVDTIGALKKDIAADIIANLSSNLAAQVTLRLSGN